MSLAKKTAIVFLILSAVGFLDAGFLTVEHYLNAVPPCSIVQGCEKVTTSEYSVILGIPVALMGAVYYLVMLLGSIYYLDSKNEKVLRLLAQGTWAGLLASLYFTGIQFFAIRAVCIYCLVSALDSTLLFAGGMLYLRGSSLVERKGNEGQEN